MPIWIRFLAAIAVVALLLSLVGSLFGEASWWHASSIVFAVSSAVVWVYQLRRNKAAAQPSDVNEP